MAQTKVTYVATAACYVADKRGNVKVHPVGTTLKQAQWVALKPSQQAKFQRVETVSKRAQGVQRGADVTVSDRAVLGLLLDRFDRGLTLDGGYGAVWAWVAGELGVDPSWAHYRAAQLARVGRGFERATGVSFATLCPGLPAVATEWVSDLA